MALFSSDEIIQRTITFVKDELKNAEGGHDWFHIERVYKNSLLISESEKVDRTIVSLGALLHDIADSKFHQGDETVGPKKARQFLKSQNIFRHEGQAGEIVEHVIKIIENISFKGGNKPQNFTSKELEVVQDADRLDALGAIGIARTFNYGGFKNRKLYDPEIKPNLKMTPAEYKASTAPTINHFYEKLLLLKDKMNTETGRKIAEERHAFMEKFLQQFYAEWEGKK
ncbi:HD domain-containing protein [Aequorivita vladivostokensis]|mgnify:CR=1 FL=1|uniref:Phosphohydrolase n=1 Tax=Aequorivita vladivostokensis TaxID=171194 RepID=A0ABR5DJ02_9FLAO|nr:HD domain-containing protein [Aequorivita vladivostokensis]KJJ38765.1 phosphohydrolase [Aequorivita vladivostokensis]MAB58116.1 HD domain-containing protein [Aequorivita sp.]MBF30155.1 HD domain-containing protein [Aequorivita sp.]|tara:strand:+ start:360521 stop:361201 length:681 start_codon:yes stop_codon:yes gene_type:complete